MEKICSTCKKLKLIKEFNKKTSSSDGFDYSCRECNKERIKKWKKNNKEYISPNRQKITFICKECRKETTLNKESYSENKCPSCKRKRTNLEKYNVPIGFLVNRKTLKENKTHKECSFCGKFLLKSEFAKNKTKKDNIGSICITCNKEKIKIWNEKNPDKKKILDKNYREKNKESISKRCKNYYQKNKFKIKKRMNKYYKNNKEKIKEKVRKYNETENGKETKRASSAKRRKVIGESFINNIDIDFITNLKKITSNCSICGALLTEENGSSKYNLDHIIPLNIGGQHTKNNVRFICQKCNLTRPTDGSDVFINRNLNPSYLKKENDKQFSLIINNEKNYNSLPQYNRLILTYQQHFYKAEKKLWEDENIRKKIYINRIKYINKQPQDLTDREILRAFKISGTYYGFSHFSPFWIKSFIKEFSIKSVYDFCGGWGHRLLGAWNINYYYNDLNIATYNGVKNIYNNYKHLNNKAKLFFNEDSSQFILNKKYDAVFTCPPYFKKENYDVDIVENYNDWLNNWWRRSVRNSIKNCEKYFAFVINQELKENMKQICLEEGLSFLKEEYLGKVKSHFTNGIKESLLVFNVM